jgi:hypothetical protein
MKIAIVSFYYYNNNYWCNREILQSYCDLHGYDLHYTIEKVESENIHSPTYDGMVYMKNLFSEGYDWVFWLDGADIIISNPKLKLEDMISDRPIQFSNDVITNNPVNLYECNSGFWGVRNCDISKTFLNDVLESYDDNYHNGWSEEFWGDQDALKGIGEGYSDHIDTSSLHQSYWFYNTPDFYNMDIKSMINYFGNQSNNRNVFKFGDFLIHFAGRVLSPKEMENIYDKLQP